MKLKGRWFKTPTFHLDELVQQTCHRVSAQVEELRTVNQEDIGSNTTGNRVCLILLYLLSIKSSKINVYSVVTTISKLKSHKYATATMLG